jgi:hypothetical protein
VLLASVLDSFNILSKFNFTHDFLVISILEIQSNLRIVQSHVKTDAKESLEIISHIIIIKLVNELDIYFFVMNLLLELIEQLLLVCLKY